MKKGFTLLELIIVIIIIGVLAMLGFTQYIKMVERGRTAEAKSILGSLRTAEAAYYMENGVYTATVSALAVEAPTACASTHYFSYSCSATLCRATRCTSGGKTPDATTGYNISLEHATGTFAGTAGYY